MRARIRKRHVGLADTPHITLRENVLLFFSLCSRLSSFGRIFRFGLFGSQTSRFGLGQFLKQAVILQRFGYGQNVGVAVQNTAVVFQRTDDMIGRIDQTAVQFQLFWLRM